jgi:hypothetical protein
MHPDILFDEADRELVEKYHWMISTRRDSLTAYATGYLIGVPLKEQKLIYLHRLIMGAKPGDPKIDHKNRNGLDCRRDNLRFITDSGNSRNQVRSNKLGVRGVRQLPSGRFLRRIKINGKRVCKSFDTIEEASKSYEKLRKEQFKKETIWLS